MVLKNSRYFTGSDIIFSDLVDGKSLLVAGLDVERYSDTTNLSYLNRIAFKKLSDKNLKTFSIYILVDEHRNDRLQILFIPYTTSTLASLLRISAKGNELNIGTKLHRYTHASATEMK